MTSEPEVREPLDFQALINSSTSRRKHLEKERTKFLFPLVFPILLEKSEVTIGDFKDYRVVCKTWDKGIQDYVQRYYRSAFLSSMKMSAEMGSINEKFERNNPRIKENYNFLSEIEWHLSAKRYIFGPPKKMDNFLDAFNSGYQQFNRNPILTRCVVISDFERDSDYYLSDPDGNRFCGGIATVLRLFGQHIHYLTIDLGHNYSSTLFEFQLNVYTWLKHVPNLEGLILKFPFDGRHTSLYLEPPTLPHLQFLEVYNVPGVIFDGIVAKARSLRHVSIQLMDEGGISYARYFDFISGYGEGPPMPLKMLNMNIRSKNDLENLEASLKRGISLKSETFCIRFYRELEVTEGRENRKRPFEFGYSKDWNNPLAYYDVPKNDFVVTSQSDECPKWSRLFRVVELLGAESLRKLSLRLPGTVRKSSTEYIFAKGPELRLNLTNLKSLVVYIPNRTSIDFLLGMKNTLEEVTIVLPNSTAAVFPEDRLKEYEIWSEMPKLVKLTLRVMQQGSPVGSMPKEFNCVRPS